MQPLPRDLGGGLAALAIPAPVRNAYAAGCHAGRLLAELSYLAHALAQATPDEPFDYAAYLAHMGLAQRYGSAKGFVHGYFFDRRNPDSLRTAMDDLQKETASLAGNLGDVALRHAKLAASAFDRAAMNLAPEPGRPAPARPLRDRREKAGHRRRTLAPPDHRRHLHPAPRPRGPLPPPGPRPAPRQKRPPHRRAGGTARSRRAAVPDVKNECRFF